MAYDTENLQLHRPPEASWSEGHIARPGRADIDDLLHGPNSIHPSEVLQSAVTRAMAGKPQLVADQFRLRVQRHLSER